MTSAKKIKNVSDMDIFDEYDAIMTGKNSPQCLSKSEKQKIIKEAKKRGIDKVYEKSVAWENRPKNILGF